MDALIHGRFAGLISIASTTSNREDHSSHHFDDDDNQAFFLCENGKTQVENNSAFWQNSAEFSKNSGQNRQFM